MQEAIQGDESMESCTSAEVRGEMFGAIIVVEWLVILLKVFHEQCGAD